MKVKGIRELEFRSYLESLLRARYKNPSIKVEKHGADAVHWFSRDGKISREPDYLAKTRDRKFFQKYEFGYATDIPNHNFIDFKVAKIGKKQGGRRIPYTDREIFYVIESENKYGFLSPAWIAREGREGSVAAWGNAPAFRVDKDVFMRECNDGERKLKRTINATISKVGIAEFQKAFIDEEARHLAKVLEKVVDKEEAFKIIPRTLEGFYQVCFLMSQMDEGPENTHSWLVYLASLFKKSLSSRELAMFMFSFDFVYFRCDDLKENELQAVEKTVRDIDVHVKKLSNKDGTFNTGSKVAPIDGMRHVLFTINLLEDIRQDAAAITKLPPVKKIFETLPSPAKTFKIILGEIADEA